MSLNGADGIRETIAGATEVSAAGVRLEAEVTRLAGLSDVDRVYEKRTAAKKLGISLAELTKLVRDKIKEIEVERRSRIVEAFEAEAQKEENPETARPTAADADAEATRLYESARPIIEADSVLALVREHLTKNEGYAGDTSPAERAYLAIASRFCKRPLNIYREAPPATGKNFSVDIILFLFPEEAYYKFTASSERAIIYTEESFKNRTIIVDEKNSLPQEEGPASSAIRAVVQDNQMVYCVVEKVDDKWQTRRIVKEGPTNLITTGTCPLEEQMATRMLTDRLSDDAGQTRLILRAQADTANEEDARDTSGRQRFVDFQKYLALKGERRVAIPFARALAELIPAEAVRVRRDFPQILTTIQTLAFLAQFQPERDTRDARGRIVATWDDYAVARELLAPVLDVSITDGVAATVRQTVEAIEVEEEISLPILAERLKLGKSGTWYRVKSAINERYLVNLEDRPRHAARIKRAQPLPDPKSALPTVEVLKAEFQKRVPDEQPEENLPAQDEEGLEL
jgi:hypothetical protein